ncbi:MAG: hypothetical protein KGI38_08255 [Thaumarchaeota archaeon]|nr:hypothetical protein [Nitrososphaerota archaeon]
MPELWIPYGNVETLVTIQAENLGVVSEPLPEVGSVEFERLTELAKGSARVFICDAAPATIEVLKGLVPTLADGQSPSFYAAAPKGIESRVPELKGRLTTLPPPLPAGDGDEPVYSTELNGNGAKLFLGSARPDPLFGLIDAKVEACLSWVARSRAAAAGANKGMEPSPFQKTEAYEAMEAMAERIPESRFLTVVPRGGKPRAAMEDPPFDAIRNAFTKIQMPQAKGMVIGIGGRGYDDTFSSAVRGVWNVIEGVRKTGSVLLIAECADGIGSTALEMLVTGRMSGDEGRRKEKYVEGTEEVFYLNKLKDEYDVLLLSGLPETYARSKLGLTTAKGSGEAVGRILNKVGRSGKLNVVPRAPENFVESG